MKDSKLMAYLYVFTLFIIPAAYIFARSNDVKSILYGIVFFIIAIVMIAVYQNRENKKLQSFLSKWL